MITDIKYIEKDTNTVVTVSTAWSWETGEPSAIVTYSSGRRYTLTYKTLDAHFVLDLPQEISFMSFGPDTDRPTAKQKEIDGNSQP